MKKTCFAKMQSDKRIAILYLYSAYAYGGTTLGWLVPARTCPEIGITSGCRLREQHIPATQATLCHHQEYLPLLFVSTGESRFMGTTVTTCSRVIITIPGFLTRCGGDRRCLRSV